MEQETKKSFIDEIDKHICQQEQQKEDGINDYNLLTSVLHYNDEVRLHSRVLCSLLDSKGTHYKNTLFLQLFLQAIGKEEFFEDLTLVETVKEENNIDLLLRDGEKSIIIENKVYANDQKKQISNYIDVVKKEILSYNILVIYLSIDRDKPSSYSLGGLTLKESRIYNNNQLVAHYMAVHYKKEIIEWLENCVSKTTDSPNLKISLLQYLDVVKMISNIPCEKLKQFDEIFKNDFKYLEFFNNHREDGGLKEILCNKKIYTQLNEAFERSINIIFYDFLQKFCYKLLDSDSNLILGRLERSTEEPAIILYHLDIEVRIYLQPGKKNVFRKNFFELKSVAFAARESWSEGLNGCHKDVTSRNEAFNKYLIKNNLGHYIIGDKKNKGPILKNSELKESIEFEDIFKLSKSDNKNLNLVNFDEIKMHIEKLVAS